MLITSVNDPVGKKEKISTPKTAADLFSFTLVGSSFLALIDCFQLR
jgi:hypothetical protein